MNRRGLFASFKSKSLDLLGSSRLQQRLIRRPASGVNRTLEAATKSGALAASSAASGGERRTKQNSMPKNKQTHSAPDSFDSPNYSRSSSVESQSSFVCRGLESALRTSAIFSWNSIESHNAHINPSSFIERESQCQLYIIIIITMHAPFSLQSPYPNNKANHVPVIIICNI